MVKKVKRFIVFVLFSLFFQLLHVKTSDGTNEGQNIGPRLGVPSAEAKCCPPGSTGLNRNGECCSGDDCY